MPPREQRCRQVVNLDANRLAGGEGIASLAAILDPAVVVIGGGVSEAGDLLLDSVRAHFRANLTGRHYRPELEIRAARLGNKAGMIGAADLARRP